MPKKQPKTKPKPQEDKPVNIGPAVRLRSEIGKVRCWLTGFHAGRGPNSTAIPGEDSLRLVQIYLDDLIQNHS